MENQKYVNQELEIEIGDVFYHKSDDRKLVVVDFDYGETSMASKDKLRPICKYFLDGAYKQYVFSFHELKKDL